jgi:hypothetical protein
MVAAVDTDTVTGATAIGDSASTETLVPCPCVDKAFGDGVAALATTAGVAFEFDKPLEFEMLRL